MITTSRGKAQKGVPDRLVEAAEGLACGSVHEVRREKVLEGGEKFPASCDHVTDASNIQLSTNSHKTVYLLTTPVTNSHPVTILHSQIRVCISLLVVVWMSRRCKFRGECGRKPNINISI